MKRTTLVITAFSTLLITGCNPMNRIGSRSASFDSDPFTQLDESSPQVARQSPYSPAGSTGRVSVGNLGAAQANGGYAARNTGNPYAAATQQPASRASYSYNPQQPAPQPIQQVSATPPVSPMATQADFAARPPQQPGMTGPGARAQAEAAAMIAKRQQQPIQQMSYSDAPSQPQSGIVTADFSEDPFEASASPAFAIDNSVPMPPEASYNAETSQFELSASDLDLNAANPAAMQNPNVFPGTNIPMPTGRALMDSVLPSQWESEPTPAAPVEQPIQANPVFQPPATGATTTPAVQPVATPQTGTPVMRDSTNHDKWRAVRRN